MAKNKAKAAEAEVNETEGAEATTESKAGGRAIVLNVDGKEIKRIDYIRELWKNGESRSAIAKKISELQGENVPYQIVFAATKGIPGGPAKTEAKDEAEETAED